jgi:hypothetical protein
MIRKMLAVLLFDLFTFPLRWWIEVLDTIDPPGSRERRTSDADVQTVGGHDDRDLRGLYARDVRTGEYLPLGLDPEADLAIEEIGRILEASRNGMLE